MNRKRGVLVVLVFVLLILIGSLVEAIEATSGTDDQKKVVALGKKVNALASVGYCNGGDGDDCWKSSAGLYSGGEYVERILDNERVGITVDKLSSGFGGDCSMDEYITPKPKSDQNGCKFVLVDIDGGSNDGAWTLAFQGTLIDKTYSSVYDATGDVHVTCDEDDAKEGINYAHFRSSSDPLGEDYFCSADNYWHICKDDSKEESTGSSETEEETYSPTYYGSFTHANNKVFNCTEWDYSTNPTKPTKTETVTWRELPGEDKDGDGVTDKLGDCQDDLTIDPAICLEREDPTECGVKYASCASCINSGATEVCGDGIDNGCRTGVKDQAALNVNDDCDFKEYQTVCKVNFDSLPNPKSSAEANLCCGDDGIKDLGTTIKAKSGNYICLNKDLVRTGTGATPDSIGQSWNTPVSSPSGSGSSPTGETVTPTTSAGTWKWVSASGDAKFTIYTIKKPGEQAYDVASSGEDWQQCSSSTEGKMTSLFDQENGDKFYCYASGDQASWVECCSKEGSCTKDGATEKVNGLKVRQAGQGTFNLMPLLKVDEDTGKNSIPFGQPGGFFSMESGTITPYEQIYGQNYPSFTGYDYLDVYFDFSGDTIEAGTTLQMEVWSTNGKLASENVLSDVINGATLQIKKVYHAQIPVSGWRDITLITFKTTPTTVPLEIKNVQVVKKDANPVCSGSNTWLNDIDEKDQAIEEGKMCKDLGLTWLGNDAVNRCCGDDQKEYGVGSKGGCWNSQGITSGQTMNDVNVELTYGKGEWVYDNTLVDVSTSVNLITDTSQFQLCENNVCPMGASAVTLAGKLYSVNKTSETTTISRSGTITSAAPTKLGDSIEFTKTNFIEATLKDSNGGTVFFFNPLDDPTSMDEEKTTIKYEDLIQEKTVYYIMAKADTLKQTYTYNPSTTETLTYSCTTSMCTFPLKGSPPYTIKNVYPAKYDLYFVNVVDGKETRTFINPEKTIYAHDGWLEVDNVPQQVVFNGTLFLGCGDTTALGTVALTNEKMCFAQKTMTDGFYCAPDYGWKKDSLPTMIYDNDNQLQLLSPEVLLKAEDRNHTSSIVFGRNILLNPMLDLTK